MTNTTNAEAVKAELKSIVDEMLGNIDQALHALPDDPEWAKINALRLMEHYKIARALQLRMEDM